MSQRYTETPEYNLFYEVDSEFEYDEWQPDLNEVEHFFAGLKKNPAAVSDVAQARIVRRIRTTFVGEWEFLPESGERA